MKKRRQIDEKYKWDLTQLCKNEEDFYKNPTRTLNWDVDTDELQYIGIILARKSDINKELTSLSSGAGKYNPIPFLRDSFYLDDTFPKDDNPRNRMNIRIEMYSYEDIYELASGRNKVFFRLLQNEFGFEEENSNE